MDKFINLAMSETDELICCFCGESLSFKQSIQISFWKTTEPTEMQGIFSHPECFDKTLHICVPRILIDENEDV